MYRSKGGMASPRYTVLLLAVFNFAVCYAGPLPNVTSVDLGLKEGSCALGDVVYMAGDEFPGASPCERCTCAAGGVQCAKQRCEPRPGCKAVHRPDHCCPTYQCECELDGRVYSNGEKLVDATEPCKVCYCQGGEVVCRRVSCFVRDDCLPRKVPGRCCPEYDNCPVRGVTSLPGIYASISSISIEYIGIDPPPAPSNSPIKPEITIKEITPVSEIPVTNDNQIRETITSSEIDVVEYSSSKSALITREATSEKSANTDNLNISVSSETKFADVQPSSPVSDLATISIGSIIEDKNNNDLQPSKISLSTQESSGEIFLSKIPTNIPLMGGPSITESSATLTTKAPSMILQEEEFDHNPAFPPIPDDLSVNHEDDIIPEQNLESDHMSHEQDLISVSDLPSSITVSASKESFVSTTTSTSEAITVGTESVSEITSDSSTSKDSIISTETSTIKSNSMINLRSVLPTEILIAPSQIWDDTTEDSLDVTEPAVTEVPSTSESFPIEHSDYSEIDLNHDENNDTYTSTKITEITIFGSPNTNEAASSTFKVPDMTSEREFSSIPIETSDQNPHENTEKDTDKPEITTTDLIKSGDVNFNEQSTSELSAFSTVTIQKNDDLSSESITEYIVTPYYPGSDTSAYESIKVDSEGKETVEILDRPKSRPTSNVLADLRRIVGDVASITGHTDAPNLDNHLSSPSSLPNSEELIPVNAGYKSKNSNWNLNSITETPFKNKNVISNNKQKVVEIEDDESDSITDSPPPFDKIEPTTRRPIIDNVSDVMPENKTDTDKKDIEIIRKSYVPNKRITKVILNEKTSVSQESSTLRDEMSESDNKSLEIGVNGTSTTTVFPDWSSTNARESIIEESTEQSSTVSK